LDSQFNSEPNLPGWFHSLGLHAALSRVAVAPQICSNSEPACTFGRCGRFFAAGLFQNTIFWMGLDHTDRNLRVFALVLAREASRQIRNVEKHPRGELRASGVGRALALHAHLRDGGIKSHNLGPIWHWNLVACGFGNFDSLVAQGEACLGPGKSGGFYRSTQHQLDV
jgi:hypothetical protein